MVKGIRVKAAIAALLLCAVLLPRGTCQTDDAGYDYDDWMAVNDDPSSWDYSPPSPPDVPPTDDTVIIERPSVDSGPTEPTAISGCTDPNANNFKRGATVDNGRCDYTPIYGCTDQRASNYNYGATVDDGSCVGLPQRPDTAFRGCTDPSAENYFALASVDDGSCVYPPQDYPVYEYTDYEDQDYEPVVCSEEDTACCDYPPPGSKHTCAEESGFGKCNESWMDGYCDLSCGRCGKTLPKGWSCFSNFYKDGSTCHCDCGAPDPDCGGNADATYGALTEACDSGAGEICIDNVCGTPTGLMTSGPLDPCSIKDAFPSMKINDFDPCQDKALRKERRTIPTSFHPGCSSVGADQDSKDDISIQLGANGTLEAAVSDGLPEDLKPLEELAETNKECFSWKEVSVCSKDFKGYFSAPDAYQDVVFNGLCDANKEEPEGPGIQDSNQSIDDAIRERMPTPSVTMIGAQFSLGSERALRKGVFLGGDCSEKRMWEDIKTANTFNDKFIKAELKMPTFSANADAGEYCRKLEDLPSVKENCWCNPKFAGLVDKITAAQEKEKPGNTFTARLSDCDSILIKNIGREVKGGLEYCEVDLRGCTVERYEQMANDLKDVMIELHPPSLEHCKRVVDAMFPPVGSDDHICQCSYVPFEWNGGFGGGRGWPPTTPPQKSGPLSEIYRFTFSVEAQDWERFLNDPKNSKTCGWDVPDAVSAARCSLVTTTPWTSCTKPAFAFQETANLPHDAATCTKVHEEYRSGCLCNDNVANNYVDEQVIHYNADPSIKPKMDSLRDFCEAVGIPIGFKSDSYCNPMDDPEGPQDCSTQLMALPKMQTAQECVKVKDQLGDCVCPPGLNELDPPARVVLDTWNGVCSALGTVLLGECKDDDGKEDPPIQPQGGRMQPGVSVSGPRGPPGASVSGPGGAPGASASGPRGAPGARVSRPAPSRTRPLPKSKAQAENKECFTCACGLDDGPIPLEGICAAGGNATGTNSTAASGACQAPADLQEKVQTGAKVCSCLRNAFSYVAKAGNGSVATDFIDFRALLPEPSRQERISNLLAAAELTDCLGEAGFFPESNLTEVLGDWEKTAPEGYTRSYFPESNLTNLATLLLAEDRCANESAGGSEGETWQAVCSPWLELLLPRSLSVIEPLLGFFGDIPKMARSQLMALEEIMALEALEEIMALDEEACKPPFDDNLLKVLRQLLKVEKKLADVQRLAETLSGEVENEASIPEFLDFLFEDVGVPGTLPLQGQTADSLGYEFALSTAEAVSAEELLQSGLAGLAEELKELQQASAGLLEASCPDLPEAEQEAIQMLANLTNAAVVNDTLGKIKSNSTDSAEVVSWFELDLNLPCVEESGELSASECEHSIVIILPSGSVGILSTLDLGIPQNASEKVFIASDQMVGEDGNLVPLAYAEDDGEDGEDGGEGGGAFTPLFGGNWTEEFGQQNPFGIFTGQDG